MKMSASAVLLISLGLGFSGCVPMIAPERPRGAGSQRVMTATPDEVREAFHRYFDKANETRPSNIPPYVMTDSPDRSEAVNTNSVMGSPIVLRYKIFLSPGPAQGQTSVELLSEMPNAGGMNQPENLAKQEKAMLDALSDSIELARARKGPPPSGAAPPTPEPGGADQKPWWK
ncbi:MAG: hypothetical protein ACHQ51_13265 [Elusimicrobiota bacterium]